MTRQRYTRQQDRAFMRREVWKPMRPVQKQHAMEDRRPGGAAAIRKLTKIGGRYS